MSEPAHTLEIMGRRRPGWSVVIALIGNGQEINTGEAGVAEWGQVIGESRLWHAVAARRVLGAADPVQRLAPEAAAWLTIDDDLDLTVPMRSVRESAGARWVGAVLDGDATAARRIAEAAGCPALPDRPATSRRCVPRCADWRAGSAARASSPRPGRSGSGRKDLACNCRR